MDWGEKGISNRSLPRVRPRTSFGLIPPTLQSQKNVAPVDEGHCQQYDAGTSSATGTPSILALNTVSSMTSGISNEHQPHNTSNVASPSYIALPSHNQPSESISFMPPAITPSNNWSNYKQPTFTAGTSLTSESEDDHDDSMDVEFDWGNSAYVRMPHSPLNVDWNGDMHWPIIEATLDSIKASCQSKNVQAEFGTLLEEAIKAYNPSISASSDYESISDPELKQALIESIPIIVDLALDLPKILPTSFRIQRKCTPGSQLLSRVACASLLANCFFCTFPPAAMDYEAKDYNFVNLFGSSRRGRVKVEKLKCILSYFNSIAKMPQQFLSEMISFQRLCILQPQSWEDLDAPMCEVQVEASKKIEEAKGMLQVDFANKYIGGGILGDGSVMEEIQFSTSPELIVSRIFIEKMEDSDAILICGTEIYSTYTGYSNSFRYTGSIQIDLTARELDNFHRTNSKIVAIDATFFRQHDYKKQFEPDFINRELHKCNVAFAKQDEESYGIATGNWGCGAFNGEPELKFIIQWLAASVHARPSMLYHTVGNSEMAKSILRFVQKTNEAELNVSTIYKIINSFHESNHGDGRISLFEYVIKNAATSTNTICDVLVNITDRVLGNGS